MTRKAKSLECMMPYQTKSIQKITCSLYAMYMYFVTHLDISYNSMLFSTWLCKLCKLYSCILNVGDKYCINQFSRFQRGSNIFQGGGGSNFFRGGSYCLLPIETHITCDFSGGIRTPCPPSGSALVNLYQQCLRRICPV